MPAVGKPRWARESVDRWARSGLAFLALLFSLAACRGTDSLTPPGPVASPSPTALPAPTPTPTPSPPVPLRIRFPSTVSALEEVFVVVEAPGLSERDPLAVLRAAVYPPGEREPFWESTLDPENAGSGVYRSREPVPLPLESVPGEWRLEVSVHARTAVQGHRWARFVQRPLAFWNLAQLGPRRAALKVPLDIPLVRQEGDTVSGVLVWEWRGERLELWWTPGPAKRLTWDTARMVAEATHPVTGGVEIAGPEEGMWGGRTGFRFMEHWPEGAAEVLLVQGADYRLYLLRLWGANRGSLSSLFQQIRETFRVD